MHSFEFFVQRGFFCRPGFLDPAACEELLTLARIAAPAPAEVFTGESSPRIDMAVRNTWDVPLDDTSSRDLGARLDALRPDLVRHFDIALGGHEGPTFLMYQPGGFYAPHTDRSRHDDRDITPVHRRVSAVIFLNAMSTSPTAQEYSGGALTFYGIVDDAAWRSFGFALQPEPGLLVAFRSDIVHEVTPVTAGDRYTIVDWFTA